LAKFAAQFMKFVIPSFLLFCSLLVGAQDAPGIECIKEITNAWEEIHWVNNHNCGATFTDTKIFRGNNPSGPFVQVGTVTDPVQESFVDETAPLVPGEPQLFYYVEHDCSGSTAQSDTISNFDPQPPLIESVSVVDGDVVVTWAPLDFPDSFGNTIFIFAGGGLEAITDVTFTSDSQAIDPNPFTSDQRSTYDISTLDGCDNIGDPSGLTHTTMHMVEDEASDLCGGNLMFRWSDYEGWDDVIEYRVLRKKDGEATGTSVGTGDPNASPLVFNYNVAGDDNVPTCFAIEAENALGVTSLSNEICYNFTAPSVDEASINKHIDLVDEPYMAAMSISDALVNTSTRAYYYNVSAAGGCTGLETSGNVRTIHLTVQDNFDLTNTLDWNAYEIENGTVTDYNIYRNDDNFASPIATVGGGTLTYTDTIGGGASTESGFCYKVEAIYDLNTPMPIGPESGLNSWSWEACVVQNSRIFVPNVFAPNGVNKVFAPKILYPNYDNFKMVILNRWGEILYETSNPDEGWDGFHDGTLVPQGVYAYYIEMKSLNGINLERKGTVLVLR